MDQTSAIAEPVRRISSDVKTVNAFLSGHDATARMIVPMAQMSEIVVCLSLLRLLASSFSNMGVAKKARKIGLFILSGAKKTFGCLMELGDLVARGACSCVKFNHVGFLLGRVCRTTRTKIFPH